MDVKGSIISLKYDYAITLHDTTEESKGRLHNSIVSDFGTKQPQKQPAKSFNEILQWLTAPASHFLYRLRFSVQCLTVCTIRIRRFPLSVYRL